MLSRRNLIALTAVAPIAPLPRLDERDHHIEPLDIGRTSILGISPDASLLVGIESGDRLCFLDAVTLEVRATSDPMEELRIIDRISVRWSPDSAYVAFSLDAWRMARDSDIYIADVATATVTNATPEGHADEAGSLLEASDVQIDLYPCWISETSLLFARNYQDENDDRVSELCTLDVVSGEVTTWELHGPGTYEYIASPIHRRSDGSFVTSVLGGSNPNDVITVNKEGEVAFLELGGIRAPMLLDASDTHLIVWDPAEFAMLLIPQDAPETATPLADLFDTDTPTVVAGFPCFGPDRGSLASVVKYGEKMRLFVWQNRKLRDCGYLTDVASDIQVQWAGNTILMAQRNNAWLYTIEA